VITTILNTLCLVSFGLYIIIIDVKENIKLKGGK
jgi:hypothetical protein